MRKLLEIVQARTQGQLVTHAKLSCRALCDRVTSLLPREIRDMIYHYILDDQFRWNNDSYISNIARMRSRLHSDCL